MSNDAAAAEFGVRRTITRYAHTMDGRKVEENVALYTDDAVLTLNGTPYEGKDAIRGWVLELAKSPAGIHMTGNTIVDVTGDKASAISDFLYVRKAPDGWKVIAAGRYADTLERRGNDWLFTRRELTVS